jgi:hypothetical protein
MGKYFDKFVYKYCVGAEKLSHSHARDDIPSRPSFLPPSPLQQQIAHNFFTHHFRSSEGIVDERAGANDGLKLFRLTFIPVSSRAAGRWSWS